MPLPLRTAEQYQQIERDWEEQADQAQKEAILAFRYRERQRRAGFKVPKWLAIVGAILVVGVVSYVFISLMFSM